MCGYWNVLDCWDVGRGPTHSVFFSGLYKDESHCVFLALCVLALFALDWIFRLICPALMVEYGARRDPVTICEEMANVRL